MAGHTSRARLGIPAWRCALLAVALSATAQAFSAQEQPTFERDVWPILATRCAACHGGEKPKGGLDLRSVTSLLRGGETGPAVVRSHPESSLLIAKLDQREMPPAGQRQLVPKEIATIRAWIATGASVSNPDAIPPAVSPVRDVDRQFWSFRPLAQTAVPVVSNRGQLRTPIDAFLMAKLAAKGLSLSEDAEGPTLVRRATLDLLGLPPEPCDVAAFLADREPGAYERLLDRLLASAHFGERWGRHWLDVAGYVDTIGFDVDATLVLLSENKWLYRDYVIRAFNEDKPYDRFITEQLSGDEMHDWRGAKHLTPAMRDALVATGYLRTARDMTHEDVGLIRQNYFGIMHDTLEVVGTGLLGLTLNCARCHDHKFDPIPQEDYYRLMALLMPAYDPQAWRPVVPTETRNDDRALPDVSPREKAAIDRHNEAVERETSPLRKQLGELRNSHLPRLRDEALAKLPEAIRSDVKQAADTPVDKRTEVQKYLAEKFAAILELKSEQVDSRLAGADKQALDELKSRIAASDSKRRRWGKIQALYDVGPARPTHLLVRGSEDSPGVEVPAGFLRVLSGNDDAALVSVQPPVAATSGRRTALARWLTERDSPAAALLARVMVNRIWQQLFGRGIVETPDNFGAQGKLPTHPELLEWLSTRFVEGGWRIKPLIKLMMLSSAYRQASQRDPTAVSGDAADPQTVDPGNELLWRMRLRRLESEIVRDSVLAVSGALDRTQGGPPIPILAMNDGMVVVAKDKLPRPADAWRRSMYLVSRRAYNLSLLTVFDQPLVATNCLRRDASAVPLQSLVMLNDAFIQEQAERLASRVEAAGDGSAQAKIATAFGLTLTRSPNPEEIETCRELLQDQADLCRRADANEAAAAHQALVQLCHVLLNTSEFLYVE
jgi:cytochrome c553